MASNPKYLVLAGFAVLAILAWKASPAMMGADPRDDASPKTKGEGGGVGGILGALLLLGILAAYVLQQIEQYTPFYLFTPKTDGWTSRVVVS